jgi:hypothetical protein
MRAPWRKRELRQAATGILQVTAGQARQMRRQAAERLRAQSGVDPATLAVTAAQPRPGGM